jgi:hypothetical protein
MWFRLLGIFLPFFFILGFWRGYYWKNFEVTQAKTIVRVAIPEQHFPVRFFEAIEARSDLTFIIEEYSNKDGDIRLHEDQYDLLYLPSDYINAIADNLEAFPETVSNLVDPMFVSSGPLLNLHLPFHWTATGILYDSLAIEKPPTSVTNALELKSKISIPASELYNILKQDPMLADKEITIDTIEVWKQRLNQLVSQSNQSFESPIQYSNNGHAAHVMTKSKGWKFISPSDYSILRVWSWVRKKSSSLNDKDVQKVFSYLTTEENILKSSLEANKASTLKSSVSSKVPHELRASYLREFPLSSIVHAKRPYSSQQWDHLIRQKKERGPAEYSGRY